MYLDKLREELPATRRGIHLNTGVVGPLPSCVYHEMLRVMVEECDQGRSLMDRNLKLKLALEELRYELGRLIRTGSREIAITQNTTDGINHVVWGMDWQPRDEILTTTLEHVGGLAGISTLSRAKGVNVVFYNPPTGFFDIDEFFSYCSGRTKLIVISHVSWITGQVLPIREISRLAHEKNIFVLVDGAQAVGAIPVDVQELGADGYAFPSHKWLLGPEGVGGLYLSIEALERVYQTFAGKFSFTTHDGRCGFSPENGAKRFETGTRNQSLIYGWKTGLEWLGKEVKWNFIYSKIRQGRDYLAQRLQEETKLRVVHTESYAGLLSVEIAGTKNVEQVVEKLKEQKIYIRAIPRSNLLRASIGFFNMKEELDQFVKTLNDTKF